MNFLRLRRVRMYAAFRPKYRYIGKALTSRAKLMEKAPGEWVHSVAAPHELPAPSQG